MLKKLFAAIAIKENNKEPGRSYMFWIGLFFAMMLKYGYYGFRYFPVVDDYNMYGIFSLLSPSKVLSIYRTYTARPVAALLDAFVISRFWNSLWLVLLGMILLHFLSAYFLFEIFDKNGIKIGVLAVIIFTLLPLGTDATYWLAASSRLVVGLFLSVLSFYLLMLYVEKQSGEHRYSWVYLAAFTLTNLLSLGFYEQVTVFCFVCGVVIMAVNFKGLVHKWIGTIPLANFAIIAGYYKYFSDTGDVARRGKFVKDDVLTHTYLVCKRIWQLIATDDLRMIKKGIPKGFTIMFSDRAWIFLIAAVAISFLIGYAGSKETILQSGRKNIIKMVLGIFLVVLPFAPFFVLQVIWISNRNVFISFIGMGLVIESVISMLGRGKVINMIRGILAACMVFAFLLVNTADIADFRSVSFIDIEIVGNFAKTVDIINNGEDKAFNAVIFNTRPIYIDPISRHLGNCTGSKWQFMGAFQAIQRKRRTDCYVLPVKNSGEGSMPLEKLKNALYIGMDNERRMFPLTGKWVDDKTLKLERVDGAAFGIVTKKAEDIFRFELK